MIEPTVGRIVHYKSSTTDECMAALIVKVCQPSVRTEEGAVRRHDRVNLNVYYHDGGQAPRFGVESGSTAGTWHWPERSLATGGLVTNQVYIGQDVPETVIPLKKQKDHE